MEPQSQQGLGAVGQQQQLQEEKFTAQSAVRENSKVLAAVRKASDESKGLGKIGTPVQQVPIQQQQQGNPQYDAQAIAAVRNGQVELGQVMSDPQVSNQAKASLQGLL